MQVRRGNGPWTSSRPSGNPGAQLGGVRGDVAEVVPGTDAERVRQLVRRFLTRSPTEEENRLLTLFVREQRVHLSWRPAAARKLAGEGPNAVERATWTALARVLMNTDEFVTKS